VTLPSCEPGPYGRNGMPNKCIRCGEGDYEKRDQETDAQGRCFHLLQCEACGSMVIRKEGWDPKSWKEVE